MYIAVVFDNTLLRLRLFFFSLYNCLIYCHCYHFFFLSHHACTGDMPIFFPCSLFFSIVWIIFSIWILFFMRMRSVRTTNVCVCIHCFKTVHVARCIEVFLYSGCRFFLWLLLLSLFFFFEKSPWCACYTLTHFSNIDSMMYVLCV